jgi:hypothetical protein
MLTPPKAFTERQQCDVPMPVVLWRHRLTKYQADAPCDLCCSKPALLQAARAACED